MRRCCAGCLLILAGCGLCPGAEPAPAPATLAILRDEASPYFDGLIGELKEELAVLAGNEWALTILEGPDWMADGDPARARTLL